MAGNISKAYQWVINTCNAPDVGYPRDRSLRNQKTVNGITYYDCSSLLYYGLINGGFDLDPNAWPFTTWVMPGILTDLGFTQFDPRNTVLKPGDILVDDWRALDLQHTEMVYKGPEDTSRVNWSWNMGAHTYNTSLDKQVSIDDGYAYAFGPGEWDFKFNKGFRYGDVAGAYGASIYVVSAILGNWLHESTINPGRYERDIVVPIPDPNVYGGYGLGQWTNNPLTGNTRRTKMARWLTDHGYPYDSGPGQMEFFLNEHEYVDPDTGETKTTGEWQAAGPYGAKWANIFPDFDSFFYSNSTDLLYLTEAFLNCWEIGDTGLDIRYAGAQTVYNWILGQGNMHPLSWIVANRALEPEESRNNALLIWDQISAGGGGGGKLPYYTRHGMPLWMMINYKLI